MVFSKYLCFMLFQKLTANVSGGCGGDMSETQANELLDDIDFYNNKVKCSKIEQILPMLNRMVREQQILIGL